MLLKLAVFTADMLKGVRRVSRASLQTGGNFIAERCSRGMRFEFARNLQHNRRPIAQRACHVRIYPAGKKT
jgi:hypothetical protein